MFIFLSKFLPLFFYPLGLAITLLIAALLTLKRKLHVILLISTLLILSLAGNRWVAHSLARSLEWQYVQSGELPQAEVIVLLGGATQAAGYPRPTIEINSAGDRLLYTYKLFNQGKAEYILLTGGGIEGLTVDDHPTEDMADVLIFLGVPREVLWLEEEARNTYENAELSYRLLKTKNIQRIILVTSAMHMPRSVALFEKQGLEVIPAPTDFTVTQDSWEHLTHPTPAVFLINLIPNADNLSLTTKAIKEYIGMAVYHFKGWL